MDAPVRQMVSNARAGELNRARVLRTLYAHGPLARPQLARLTGSTRATIGQIVAPLLEQGVLAEHDPVASGVRGGKPARPVWFSDDGWPVGAVLLLPDGVQAALVTAGGRIVASASADVDPRVAPHSVVVDRLLSCLRSVAGRKESPLRGIGIAVGGMVDTETGDVVRVGLAPGLNGLSLGHAVAAAMGVPTFVDLQPRAQALGDQLFGAGRGEDDFCSLYVGEGIGAGFILDGALHRGVRGAGGEVGHTVVDVHGEVCTCGLTGCWETVAATRWLRAQAAARGLPHPESAGTAALTALADAGSVWSMTAAGLLADYAVNVAVGIATIVQTLGLRVFILHGDPVGGGEAFRSAVQGHVHARTLAHPGGPAQIRFGDILPDGTPGGEDRRGEDRRGEDRRGEDRRGEDRRVRDPRQPAGDVATLRGAAAIVLSRSMHVAF